MKILWIAIDFIAENIDEYNISSQQIVWHSLVTIIVFLYHNLYCQSEYLLEFQVLGKIRNQLNDSDHIISISS